MNVVLPKKQKFLNPRNIVYMIILAMCVVAVAIAIYQFFSEEKLNVIVGATEDQNKDINQLKTEFKDMFTNEFVKGKQAGNQKIKKVEHKKDIVYTKYTKNEKESNRYTLDVNIPYININNNITKKFNEQIEKLFLKPAEDILKTEEKKYIYTVNYTAFIENDILSIAVLSTFMEDNSVQRTIFKVYNYNIKDDKEATINDFLSIKNIDESTIKNKIEEEIKSSQEQAEQLKKLGYDIFARDVDDEMYELENLTDYFIVDGYLYIIFAYGNKNNTSEMDIVIIE